MFSANTSQVSNDVKYIEDFCSVYLRTGTGSSQTVTTGVKENTGALVISKSRSAATDWAWYDTFRGATKDLASNTTAAETTQSQGLTSFNTDGHTWGTLAKVNTSGATYVDFVLKPTPKFFDVVTYTGDGSTSLRAIAHNLGSTPACLIIKKLSAADDWIVWHRGLTSTNYYLALNKTDAQADLGVQGFAVSDTTFSVIAGSGANTNGATYVAYLFAHNAGGFGLTGTDNVISCGSFTTDGSGVASVTLGYEPQWVLTKSTSATNDWQMVDNMRGFPVGSNSAILYPNLSNAESSGGNRSPNATGFSWAGLANTAHIYIAIRRGPMKTPTSGTSVFTTDTTSGSTFPAFSSNFPVDLGIVTATTGAGKQFQSRLMGAYYVDSTSTAAEVSSSIVGQFDSNVGFCGGIGAGYMSWMFRRAPGFFDEVCYTGDGTDTLTTPRQHAHNLGVVPELMILKIRASTAAPGYGGDQWYVHHKPTGKIFALNNATAGYNDGGKLMGSETTSSTVYLRRLGGDGYSTNAASTNYVMYLFASCPGVSKVGSYTGTGTTQQINCGFTAGARFVLIKQTNGTGGWYVFDTARGINPSGVDPYLFLNSTAAETTYDQLEPNSSGFTVVSPYLTASGSEFIYLAIA